MALGILAKIGSILGSDPITKIADLADRFIQTKEEKDEFLLQVEQNRDTFNKGLLDIEAADRKNARSRQIEMAKAGASDFMHSVVGIVGMVAFLSVIYLGIFVEIADKATFNLILGNVMGISATIFAFYFGSSKSSSEKQKNITEMIQGGIKRKR